MRHANLASQSSIVKDISQLRPSEQATDFLSGSSGLLSGGRFKNSVHEGIFNGEKVAVKCVETNLFDEDRYFELKQILEKCKYHDNIVKFIYQEVSIVDIYCYHYVFELCNENLAQWVANRPAVNKIDALNQVAQGVLYLHDNSIVHLDINPENILVKNIDTGAYCMKISNFGKSRICQQPAANPSEKVMLKNSDWTAPEMINPNEKITSVCTFFFYYTGFIKHIFCLISNVSASNASCHKIVISSSISATK